MNGPCRVGYEYMFDGAWMARSWVTLGAWSRPWNISCDIPYSEVGRFEKELFVANEWKPNYPNLAFRSMDEADGYWGSEWILSFRDLGEERGYADASERRYDVVVQDPADLCMLSSAESSELGQIRFAPVDAGKDTPPDRWGRL